MKKKFLTCVLAVAALVILAAELKAQTVNGTEMDGKQSGTVSTAVPFLLITPDSRAGAMGDVGVSTSADANSMAHNAAKLAFAESPAAVSMNYSPWLRALGVKDINLAYVSGYRRIDERQTLAASFRYFSLGDLTFTDINGNILQHYKPSEFALDASYIRKMSPNLSMATALRYIHSDLGSGVFNGNETSSGNALAVDVGVFYTKDMTLLNAPANLAWGVNIANIGSKMNYGSSKSFLPTTFKLGGTADFHLDHKSSFAWTVEFNKLLVPANASESTSVPSGIFDSFSSSQLAFGTGVEYAYNKLIALRGGFFTDNPKTTNKQYLTTGVGLRHNAVELDFSYLIPTATNNPLEKTIRFSLIYNFSIAKPSKEEK